MKKIFFLKSLFFLLFVYILNAQVFLKGNIQVLINSEKIYELPLYEISGKKEEYVLLRDLAKIFNATLTFHSVGNFVSFNCKGEKIFFYFNKDYIIFNNQKVFLSSEILNYKNRTYVPISLLNNSSFAKALDTSIQYQKSKEIVIINENKTIDLKYYVTKEKVDIEILYSQNVNYNYNCDGEKIVLLFPELKTDEKIYKIVNSLISEIEISKSDRNTLVKITLSDRNVEIKKQDYKNKVVLSIQKSKEKKIKKTIVIDPGHGGEDTGAIGPRGTKEKDVNLIISKFLKEKLEKDNFIVYLTRENDEFIPLVKRTEFANKKNADLFISIHCNASFKPKGSDNGFEVYFLSEKATDPEAVATEKLENEVVKLEKPTEELNKLQKILWSLIVNEFINESSYLCSLIGQEVTKITKQNYRGVKQAGFYVLRGAQMPAVLVECGFISCEKEELMLASRSFQDAIAEGIYKAIKKYYEENNK